LLPLSLLNLLLGACAGIFSATIDGIQFIYFRNFIAATLTIIYLGLTIFFVPSLGLIGVVYAQIIQTCLMILAYLMIIYWKVPKFSIVRLRTNRNVFRELFGYGINFQIISLSNLFFDPITKYFLSRYGGLSITGYYEMANRLIIQLRSLIVNTMQVIVPAIANIHAKGAVNIKKLYLKWFPFLFLGSLILITYLISLANYISIVWIGRLEESFIVILIIIAFGWFFNIISALAYFIDLGTGDLKWNVVSQVVMTSSNVILCYLFGKIWGGYYIVIGTMFSLIISSIILLIAFNKQFNIQLKELFYPKIWIIIGISLFSIAASYLFYFFANPIISFPLLLAFNFLILTGIMIFNFWRSNLLYKLPSNSLKSENQIN
jgi:O-antigen/teichoic acid export membrane protein